MDTKEDLKIQQTMASGGSHTDEGPYYHESWWESYKGSVKGELGGVFIGAIVGAVAGLVGAGILALIIPGGVSVLAITASFAAAGMLYEAHEFNQIGKVTGAVAAAHEKSEERMKSFETGKFNELKNELSSLKSAVTGQPVTIDAAASKPSASTETHSDTYESQHVTDASKAQGFKPIFWKIAAIGLAVGLAAGALLSFGGVSEHILSALGATGEHIAHAGHGAATAATMTVTGLFGASFGVNRDMFRSVFDRTDHLFKGIVFPDKQPAIAPTIEQPIVNRTETKEPPINTVVYTGFADYPASDTYHRDLVLSRAKDELLGMDHTKFRPN